MPDASARVRTHQFSQIFVENGQISKEECAAISQFLVENCSFSNEECASISPIFVKKCIYLPNIAFLAARGGRGGGPLFPDAAGGPACCIVAGLFARGGGLCPQSSAGLAVGGIALRVPGGLPRWLFSLRWLSLISLAAAWRRREKNTSQSLDGSTRMRSSGPGCTWMRG